MTNDSEERKKNIKNGALNLVSTVIGMTAPLIVYSFVLRVLGAERYGEVSYVQTVASYFILLATVGIDNYAQRECSVCRDNYIEFSVNTIRIIRISLVFTAISLVLYCLLFQTGTSAEERKLFAIFGLGILASGLKLEWFYVVREKFRTITIRNLISKLLYVSLTFVFVRNAEDYLIYALVLVTALMVFPMILNCYGVFCGKDRICYGSPKKSVSLGQLKAVLLLGLMTIGSKLFSNMDVLVIKEIMQENGNKAVGLYNASVLLPHAIEEVLMAVAAVIAPSVYILVAKQDYEKTRRIMNDTCDVLLFITIPMVLTCLFFSRELLMILGGEEYLAAYRSLQVYSFVILTAPFITLAGTRLYIALHKERELTCILFLTALFNLLLDIILVSQMGYLGATVGTLISNTVLMAVELTIRKSWNFVFSFDKLKYCVCAVIIAVSFSLCKIMLVAKGIYLLLLSVLITGVIYILACFLLKENTIMTLYSFVKKRNTHEKNY